MATKRLTKREELEALCRAVVASPVALSKILWIDHPSGPRPFELWPDQIEALRVARIYRKVVALKARQLGMTWTMASLLGLWECCAYPSGADLVLSQNEDDAKDVIARARFLWESGPDWFKASFPLVDDRTDRISIGHGRTKSTLMALSSASGAGRGRTFRRVIADERAHWENSDERMASIEPAVADYGSIIQISTAKGYNTFRDTYLQAVEPGQDVTLGNGYVRMFFGALSHPDRDLEAVMRMRASLGRYGPQEYPLSAAEAFLASGDCVFDEGALQQYLDHVCEPPRERVTFGYRDGIEARAGSEVEIRPGGDWQVWERPREGRSYVISADTCGGGGGRDSAYAFVVDALSWDQVAALHGRLEPVALAYELERAGYAYNTALLAPEANNHGAAVVATLIGRRYPNLYRRRPTNRQAAQTSQLIGWETTAKSRPEMLDALKDVIRYRDLGIRDASLIGECLSFVENERGKEEAMEGKHDDRVMAAAIASHVLSHSPQTRERPEYQRQERYRPSVSSKTGY